MIYFTSDNHFHHQKVIEYENRPFNSIKDMDEAMIERWNERVKKSGDIIYILGDFCFDRKGDYVKSILKRLNGEKYFIRGNHDYFLDKINTDEYFGWVKDYYKLNYGKTRIILFHYPIYSWDCKQHGSIHLHGHSHKASRNFETNLGLAYDVGVDNNNFAPISLPEIIKKLGLDEYRVV